MSALGWFLGAAAIWGVDAFAKKSGWSKLKRCGSIVLILAICYGVFGNGSSGLEKAGQEYILQRLKSPSTANFLSYTSSSTVKKYVLEEWDFNLKDNWDIVMIEVEATNGFGGRNRTTYAVFFKDGEPQDMLDADKLNKETLNRTLSFLGY